MGSAVATMARAYAGGGKVQGPGTGTSDSVPVRLSKGEYVIPADSVKAIGINTLHALVASTHKHVAPKGKAPARRMANGGLVADIAAGIKNLVSRGGTGAANPQNNEARQAAGLTAAAPAPAPAPAKPPVDPNNPAGIRFVNGGLVGHEDQVPSYGEQMSKVGGLLASGIGTVAKTVVGAPGYGLNALTGASVADAPAADTAVRALPAGVSPSTAGPGRGAVNPTVVDPNASAGRGTVNPPAVDPNASAAAVDPNSAVTLGGQTGTPVASAPGVSKFAQNGSTLYSNVQGLDNDALMARGQPSAVNRLAMDNIQARQDAGDQAAANRAQYTKEVADAAATNARGGFNTGGPVTARQALSAQLSTGKLTPQGAKAAEALMSNDVSQGQLGIAASRLALETEEAEPKIGLSQTQLGAAQRLAGIQQQYLQATDPAVRRRLYESLIASQGHVRSLSERFTVVPQGSQVDPATGLVTHNPSKLFDNQLGKEIALSEPTSGAGSAATKTPPANHIAALKANPALAAQFDAQYGKGASKQYLGGQ